MGDTKIEWTNPVRFLALLLGALISAPIARAQDKYQGLVLDQTTTDEAMRVLGVPLKDKISSLDAGLLNNRLSDLRKQKVFRILELKGEGEYRKVRLAFLSEKLVMIDVEYSTRVPVANLSQKIGIAFEPYVSYSVTSARYPLTYEIIGASSERLVVATCTSEMNGTQAGFVVRVRQISRASLGRNGTRQQ